MNEILFADGFSKREVFDQLVREAPVLYGLTQRQGRQKTLLNHRRND